MANDKLLNQINELLNNIKIFINNDGGDVNFVSFENGILTLKISGNCVGCAFIDQTYDEGIKYTFMQKFPEIKDVVFKI